MVRKLTASILLVAAAAALAPAGAGAKVYSGADRDVPLARFQDPLCPGIAGVAPRATIMPLKVGDSGSFSLSAAAAAVNYAVVNGARVINASWGTTGITRAQVPWLEAAVERFNLLREASRSAGCSTRPADGRSQASRLAGRPVQIGDRDPGQEQTVNDEAECECQYRHHDTGDVASRVARSRLVVRCV